MPVHIGEMNSDVVQRDRDSGSGDQQHEPARRRRAFDDALRSARERMCRLKAVDRDD